MNEERARVLNDGLWIGLIGYVTVALVTGVLDVLRGASFFYTPAVLGGALFGRAGPVAVTPEVVFPYNGVHLLTFLAIGMLIAVLVREVELHPVLWFLAFFVLLGMFFYSLALIGAIGAEAGPGVPWTSILVADAAAAVAMGVFVRSRHPGLWRAMRDESDPEATEDETQAG